MSPNAPDVQASRQRTQSRRVIWLYAGTMLLMLGGVIWGAWQSWDYRIAETRERLAYNVRVASSLIDASLADAMKLLEISRSELRDARLENMSASMIDAKLHDAAERFGLQRGDNETFGLLLYIDLNGQVIGQSGVRTLRSRNVSDRHYFQALVADPSRLFVVGNLVVAHTTGEWVFHIAVPVRDTRGKLLGILAQQIRIDRIASLLELGRADRIDRLITYLANGRTLFSYPQGVNTPAGQTIEDAGLFERINLEGKDAGEFSTSGFMGNYVAYVRSSEFGLTTVAMTSTSSVVAQFAVGDGYYLAYLLGAIVLVSYLFRGFYRKSLEANLMQERSVHDALTGLYNRRGINDALPQLLRNAQRKHESLSVLFVDIDHFKRLNDQYGHDVGDEVLICLARLLIKLVRRPYDFICRWGGEEFVVLLPGTDSHGALYVADQILRSVREMRVSVSHEPRLQITVSIGVASTLVDRSTTHNLLIHSADVAMRQAKDSGRDRIVVARLANQAQKA